MLTANAAPIEAPDYREPIRTHLLSLGATALADMLLDLAECDPALLRRLDLAVSAARAPVDHAVWLRQALGSALRSGSDVEDPETWLQEILGILEQVPPLIAGGAATDAKDLLESMLDDLPGVAESMHEPGNVTEAMDRAVALHLAACRVLRPDAPAAGLHHRAPGGGSA